MADQQISKKAEAKELQEPIQEREQWSSQIEFLLACVGYAVGLGNVWRFPYLCYKNGGGAFLIPYFLSLFLAGLPIFYLEMAVGQFSALGPNIVFAKIAPISRGIGWGMVMLSFLVGLYYNMIIAWVLFYFVASFRSTLQWSSCFLDYGYTARCYSDLDKAECVSRLNDSAAQFFNRTCFTGAEDVRLNISGRLVDTELVTPAEEYFERYVLDLSPSFQEIGGIQWKLALALLAAWIIVFLCLIKGVKSTGKVVYFTATFPYLVLLILLIRGCTLDGAADGIRFYMTPKFEKLRDVTVWKDGAVQIFYSLGPAFGSLLTMSSYNKFNNNCYRDAVIVAFTNSGTSIFAGFAIFSVTGFMAKTLGKEVKDVVRDGSGLAFIAYPEAIVRMPGAPFWSILFFFMLLTLGLDSQFAMVETVTSAMGDQFPLLRRRKTAVLAAICATMFLLGLPLCTRGGMYVFTLFNDYSAGYCLILLALLELLTVVHLYGIRQLCKDIELMLGHRSGLFWRVFGPTGWYCWITWLFLAPLFLAIILVFNFVFYAKSQYGKYTFGDVATGFGWAMSLLSIGCVPAFAIAAVVRNRGKPWTALFRPTSDWGPAESRDRSPIHLELSTMDVSEFSSL